MRKYDTYRRALENEYAFAAQYRDSIRGYKIDARLPNPPKIQRIPDAGQFLLERVARVARSTWWYICYPGAVVLSFVVALVWWLDAKRYSRPRGFGGRVGVVLTHRLPEVVNRLEGSDTVDIYLTAPWVSVEKRQMSGTPTVRFAGLISPSDLFGALADCVAVVSYLKGKLTSREQRLFTYSAYRWFLAWRVLSVALQSANEVWFANHYDRWALLLDGLPLNDTKRCMLQHGLVEHGPVPERLDNVDVLYCYDEGAKSRLYSSVLACSPKVRHLPAAIQTDELPAKYSDYFTVLIVGQPLDPEAEVALAQTIRATIPEVWVLIKPHPVYPKKPYQGASRERITVIEDDNWYPDVDLVVYSRSTLGYEYESSGFDTVRSPNLNVEDVLASIDEAVGEWRQ